jgi:hypothetical protein
MPDTDVAGERRTDIVAIRPDPLRIDVFRNSGSAFDGGIEWRSEPYDYSAYLFRFGDIRGRGRADVIAVQPNPLRVVTWRNNGSAFDEGGEWHTESHDYSGHLFFAADIDGDGRTDLIAVRPNPLRIVAWRNHGTGLDSGRERLIEPYDYSGYLFFAGDIEGDRRNGIVAIQRNPLRAVTWRNNGHGFDAGREWLTEPYDYSGHLVSVGDIDGDGRTDIVAVRQNPLRIVTWRNNGSGFDVGREWLTEPYDYIGYLLSVGDIDGDGKADIVGVHRTPLRMVTWRNNGNGFEGGREWFPPAGGPEIHSALSALFGQPAPGPITILMMAAASRQADTSI